MWGRQRGTVWLCYVKENNRKGQLDVQDRANYGAVNVRFNKCVIRLGCRTRLLTSLGEYLLYIVDSVVWIWGMGLCWGYHKLIVCIPVEGRGTFSTLAPIPKSGETLAMVLPV